MLNLIECAPFVPNVYLFQQKDWTQIQKNKKKLEKRTIETSLELNMIKKSIEENKNNTWGCYYNDDVRKVASILHILLHFQCFHKRNGKSHIAI